MLARLVIMRAPVKPVYLPNACRFAVLLCSGEHYSFPKRSLPSFFVK